VTKHAPHAVRIFDFEKLRIRFAPLPQDQSDLDPAVIDTESRWALIGAIAAVALDFD
jgi:hypothetical protein